jgi:hypothetical protein
MTLGRSAPGIVRVAAPAVARLHPEDDVQRAQERDLRRHRSVAVQPRQALAQRRLLHRPAGGQPPVAILGREEVFDLRVVHGQQRRSFPGAELEGGRPAVRGVLPVPGPPDERPELLGRPMGADIGVVGVPDGDVGGDPCEELLDPRAMLVEQTDRDCRGDLDRESAQGC